MPTFKATVDISGFVAGRQSFEKKQLPFAAAAALTATAKDAQVAVQGNVRQAFKNRNDWTVRNIKVKPATRSGEMSATVYTDTANRRTGAGDYLGRQEDGGTKVPVNGRHHIAVPTKYLRQMAPGIIPAELRPKALLGAVAGRYAATKRNGQIALRNQNAVRGLVFFLVDLKGGDKAIMGRALHDKQAYAYYILVPSVKVKKSGLRMEETVQSVANARFATNWDATWQRIYARGLKI